MSDIATDSCYRCGYNLTGIADDQACPECGLLAERSRRVTDELHQTRPRWLRRLSWGVWLILIAIVSPIPLEFAVYQAELFLERSYTVTWGGWIETIAEHLPFLALDISISIVSIGVLLLASREGYPPADQCDAKLRASLRLSMLSPWAALILLHADVYIARNLAAQGYGYRVSGFGLVEFAAMATATLGCTPLPILLGLRLRGLAQRARSAHLAEHCLIVGIGVALTLVYVFAVRIIMTYAETWGWGAAWADRGLPSLLIIAIMGTFSFLFVLWALYLMIRFAIAFARTARNLRRQWRNDDRAIAKPG